jgi:hypothetical protein
MRSKPRRYAGVSVRMKSFRTSRRSRPIVSSFGCEAHAVDDEVADGRGSGSDALRAMQLDRARYDRDESLRAAAQKRGDLLIPIIKGWSTELGTSLTSIGVQVHGGVGFVEETGAVQYLRDVRICTIYEGTTGIQASDLVGRKVIATIPRCFSQECRHLSIVAIEAFQTPRLSCGER